MELLYIVFKSSRVYYGGTGYAGHLPTTFEMAQGMAQKLTEQNPVGFIVLPYQEELITHLDTEKVDLYNPKPQYHDLCN